ncbi:MAG: hypothetical protein ACLSVD_12585 [Eggerthellaceae bacterium]
MCGTGPTALSSCTHAPSPGRTWPCWSGATRSAPARCSKATSSGSADGKCHVDLPAAQAHHRSFRTAYERTTFVRHYTTSTKALAAADLVVNAHAWHEQGDGSPFDVELLSAGQTVFDAVYGRSETALVRAARSGMYGARRRGMLVTGGGCRHAGATAEVDVPCLATSCSP